jgi:hypothetical protein
MAMGLYAGFRYISLLVYKFVDSYFDSVISQAMCGFI